MAMMFYMVIGHGIGGGANKVSGKNFEQPYFKSFVGQIHVAQIMKDRPKSMKPSSDNHDPYRTKIVRSVEHEPPRAKNHHPVVTYSQG
jgi:hypothetical protein